jgi:hypothetical protein
LRKQALAAEFRKGLRPGERENQFRWNRHEGVV